MGKRIRHLEFYGFPDQNVFTSLGDVDLSDIYKTNEEQDKEINEISGITNDKADLSLVQELSSKTDTFISRQGEINDAFMSAISGNTDRITALESADEEIINKVNEVVSGLNEVNERVDAFEGDIQEMQETLQEHVSSATEAISALSGSIDTLKEEKLSVEDAEAIYAKKTEVYSREEADETFLKEHQDISNLVTKDEFNELKDEVEEIVGHDFSKYALKTDLDELSGKVDSHLDEADAKFEEIDSSISGLDQSIQAVDAKADAVNDKVLVLSGKTESLEGDINDVRTELDKKLNKTTFDNYVSDMEDTIDAINSTKASKAELIVLSGTVDGLSAELSNEKTVRKNADDALGERIDAVNSDIDDIKESANTLSERVDGFDERLDQEIQDRINGDKALIGTSADTMSDDTIWGAKKYAVNQRIVAVTQAKEYTDDKFATIETFVANEIDDIKTTLSGKADKDYVDAVVDDKVEEASETLDNKIQNEIDRAQATENNLQYQIDQIAQGSGSTDLKEVYKRINVITTYSGDTPEEYIDSGNGILDVLHREFHQLEEEIGVVINPTLERTNENEVAFGNYNISHSGETPAEQTAFSIGNGTSEEERSNAIEVRKNGDLYLWVEGEFMCINDLLAMLAHETYN